MKKTSEKAALIKILTKYALLKNSAGTSYHADMLIKLAKIMGACAVRKCNEEMNATESTANNARADRAYAHVQGILQSYDPRIVAHDCGDPRGYPLKLDLPNGEFNEWGNQYGIGEE